MKYDIHLSPYTQELLDKLKKASSKSGALQIISDAEMQGNQQERGINLEFRDDIQFLREGLNNNWQSIASSDFQQEYYTVLQNSAKAIFGELE